MVLTEMSAVKVTVRPLNDMPLFNAVAKAFHSAAELILYWSEKGTNMSSYTSQPTPRAAAKASLVIPEASMPWFASTEAAATAL